MWVHVIIQHLRAVNVRLMYAYKNKRRHLGRFAKSSLCAIAFIVIAARREKVITRVSYTSRIASPRFSHFLFHSGFPLIFSWLPFPSFSPAL